MGNAGRAGKLELYCCNRAAVAGKMQTYRYANIVIWNDQAGSQPYGAGYFVRGADSAMRQVSVASARIRLPFYGNVQMILTPEKK